MMPKRITNAPLPYLPYEPDTETSVPVPLILFLHGSGERGSDLVHVGDEGLTEILANLPEDALVVVPQCAVDSWWTLELTALETLLDEIQTQYPVDPARIYLTGLSMGGHGAWHLALKTPKRFAALVPVCGGGIPALAAKLEQLPIWAFHGAEDDVVPLSASTKMVEALEKAGGDVNLTVYPSVGHNSWAKAYSEPELYTWMFAQCRI